ncbi:hypothetical protein DFH07DRAFT_819652 [Mycena maculata]|uniref:Uncharacterized protein n=1 Tax=Mycena maculata TaxID=230809 RepID=A0AAD7J7D5_9AGAR|nr:hypothetical protein DFH07DRAFT_819652 [Mycena maculata]
MDPWESTNCPCSLMAMFPLAPTYLAFTLNTLTPIFVPTPADVLAIESYFGLSGPGFTFAFLYNPTDPNSGIAMDDRGRLAPVLETRWREFERAVAGAQAEMSDPRGGGGTWSRPQNWTCPTDMYYDLGLAGSLVRFTLSGHTVSARYDGYPDDVQWYTPDGKIKVVDAVPNPFLEVERIIRSLSEELFPRDLEFERTVISLLHDIPDWSLPPNSPISDEVTPMLRAIMRTAGIRRWKGVY